MQTHYTPLSGNQWMDWIYVTKKKPHIIEMFAEVCEALNKPHWQFMVLSHLKGF